MVFVRRRDEISVLPLTADTQACLRRGDMGTVGALLGASQEALAALPGMKEENLTELHRVLRSLKEGTGGYALPELGVELPAKRGRLTWALDEDGMMTIRGTGAMADYTGQLPPPWEPLKGEIRVLCVTEGVTCVSARAFQGCGELREVHLACSVERVGYGAFSDCRMLEAVTSPRRFAHLREKSPGGAERVYMGMRAFDHTPWALGTYGEYYIADGVLLEYFGDGQDLTIPEGVKEIAPMVFENKPIQSVLLPESLQVIRSFAFRGTALRKLTLPAGLERVESMAFGGARDLNLVMLLNKNVTVDATAFSGTPVQPVSRRVQGKWASIYGMYSFKTAGMADYKRLKVCISRTRRMGVPNYDAGKGLLRRLQMGSMVLRIRVDEETKRVDYVQAFAMMWKTLYFTQLMYPCVDGEGALDIWRDSTTYLDKDDILCCNTSGLWPREEQGSYQWYAVRYCPYAEYEAPLLLLKRWLQRHPGYTVDTIEENKEKDRYRMFVPG